MNDTKLKAGVYIVDITPRDFPWVYLAGFMPDRKSRGILDPIEAGILYLTDGEEEVTLITLDLIGLHRSFILGVRNALADIVKKPENVLLCSDHVHSGPDTIGLWGKALLNIFPYRSGVFPEYMETLKTSIVRGIAKAAKYPVPVKIRACKFDTPPDFIQNDRKGGIKEDWALAFAVEKADDGSRIASVLNFAAHPETLWEHNKYISADYPGEFRKRMREKREWGEPLFFSSALGGMVTTGISRTAEFDERVKCIHKIGSGLADIMMRELAKAPYFDAERLRVKKRIINFPVTNWRFKLMRRLGLFPRDFPGSLLESEINFIEMGALKIITAPGEVTAELGRKLREIMPGDLKMLFCLGCDEIGYILDQWQFDNTEYKYEVTMSLGRDTGKILLDETKNLISG
jgi:hypothetical protein